MIQVTNGQRSWRKKNKKKEEKTGKAWHKWSPFFLNEKRKEERGEPRTKKRNREKKG